MINIEIFPLSDDRHIDKQHIQTLLEQEEDNKLNIKARPVTQIIANKHYVIKLRTEYVLADLQARRFIQKAILKEQTYKIYHPLKTWFLLFDYKKHDQTDTYSPIVIGNITPLLLAFNCTNEILTRYKKTEFVQNINKIIDLYFNMLIKHQAGLDLCLSNFGLDDSGSLYYLDDDIYGPDNFATLCDFLAVLIRSESWLNQTLIEELANKLRISIQNYYHDPHYIIIIAEQFRHLFIPDTLAELRRCFLNTLQIKQKFTYSAPENSSMIALIADIHANAPALEVVLNYLEKRPIDHTLVLGDIVGYGPHPDICIDIIRKLNNMSAIKGNHDHAVASGRKMLGSSSQAGWAINWTIHNISDNSVSWLKSLPPYLSSEDWLAVHGSPIDKTFFNAYVYHMTYIENLNELRNRDIRLCFHGHTHIQKIYHRTHGVIGEYNNRHEQLSQVEQALICPGSVGQPRGGTPGAEFAILNLQTLEIELHRLDYNQEIVLKDMKNEAFPPELADRLLKGN